MGREAPHPARTEAGHAGEKRHGSAGRTERAGITSGHGRKNGPDGREDEIA